MPIVFFSGLFLELIRGQFDERFKTVMDFGSMFLNDIVEDEQRELALKSYQMVDREVGALYRQALRSGNTAALEKVLADYKVREGLDVVVLIGADGKPMVNLGGLKPLKPWSMSKLVDRALTRGHAHTGIKRFYQSDGKAVHLTFVVACPLKLDLSRRDEPQGVLMLGRFAQNSPSIQTLSQVMSHARLKFIVRPGLKEELLESDTAVGEVTYLPASPLVKEFIERVEKNQSNLKVYQGLEEKVTGGELVSQMVPLRNGANPPVGYMAVSLPRVDLQELKSHSTGLIAFFLFVVLVIVMILGAWFQRQFVQPMDLLSRTMKDITQGKRSCRVSDASGIDEIADILQGFNQMLDTLEENERFRNTFITSLTHDLKTPLIAQKRVLDIFGKEFAASQKTELMHLAEGTLKNNEMLLEMIQMLLEMGRYREGQVTLCYDRVDINALVDDCVAELAPLLSEHHIQVHVDLVEVSSFSADPQQLKRVFLNLIGNTIEHVPEGTEIYIYGQMTAGQVHLEVCDTGPGMSQEMQVRAFDQYVTSKEKKHKIGAGLGLYICKMIVESHGGSIQVGSHTDQGVCFMMVLPREPKAMGPKVPDAGTLQPEPPPKTVSKQVAMDITDSEPE